MNNKLLPVGVLVTSIGFTFSLVFATQVGGDLHRCSMQCSGKAGGGRPAGQHTQRGEEACLPQLGPAGIAPSALATHTLFPLPPPLQGMLQTFADLRGMVASVRRVRATLSELPPDESMAQALPPLPEAPWEYPLVAPFSNGDGPLGLADEGPVPVGAANGSHVVAGEGLAVAAAQCGDLRLEGISFSYPVRPGAPVLKDLSLTLPRGKVTALVGR